MVAVIFQRDGTLSGGERIHQGDFLRRQLEVENVNVLQGLGPVRRLRNGNGTDVKLKGEKGD